MKNNLKTIQCTSHTILIAAILCFFVFSFLVVHNTSFASIAPEYEHLLSIKNNNLSAPSSVAVDAAGNMYITESSENRLHIFNSSGTLTNTLSGLNRPVGVAVAPDGKIYVGNTGAQNVGVYDTDLSFIKKLGSGDGEVKKPNAIAVAGSGTIYIADSDNNVIKVYSPEGIMINTMGGGSSEVPTPDGKFYFPTSVAIDESAQELVITDKQVISGSSGGNVAGARVQVFDLQGNYKRSFGEMGLDPGQLSNTYGVAVDSEGRIFATNKPYDQFL
jgi:streptogramin lyase